MANDWWLAGGRVCNSSVQGWGTEQCHIYKALGFIPTVKKEEETNKRLRARVVDGIVCYITRCWGL